MYENIMICKTKNGKFFRLFSPSPCPTFILINLCATMFPSKYLDHATNDFFL